MALASKKNSHTMTIDVEVTGSRLGRLVLLLPAVGSFVVSLALAVALVGLTYCAVIEVKHIHRTLINAD